MGMSGINKELEGLKIRVSYAEGAEKDFNSKRDKLRKDFEDKLSQLDNEKKKVQIYKDQINILQNQVRSLNSSIQEIRKQPVFDVNSVKSDLDKIKTGMADIGSSISKLENNHIVLEKRVSTLSAKTHKIQNILTNVTSDMNNGNRAIPSLRSTTVKPFVVTLTPNENSVVKFKQFKRAIAEVEEKQKDLCQTQSEQFWKEISNLKNRTTLLNETYLKKFENLKTLLNEKDAIATKAPSKDSLKATPSPSPTTTTTTKKPTTFHSSSETTLPNTKDDSPKNDLETIDSLAQDLNKRRRSIYKKRNA
ncbi:uncharacterized protein [Clytia hemisphaerica]|uniref:Uncharacterized protein n=1 Tax=Clytia hemisphaerica TaxID=252671 RepID=A0A7M5UKV3_9CNID